MKKGIIITALITVIVAVICLYFFNKFLDSRNASDGPVETGTEVVLQDSTSNQGTAPEPTLTGQGEPSYLLIDKGRLTLYVMNDKDEAIRKFGIACGRNYGNKQGKGDFRTPEGDFEIQNIEDASNWSHDFNDGKGVIDHCYGNWFIRLKTPGHSGIGIHGTHAPESIGTRATEGCIRLKNENLDILKEMVKKGMRVVIIPGSLDAKANAEMPPQTDVAETSSKKDK